MFVAGSLKKIFKEKKACGLRGWAFGPFVMKKRGGKEFVYGSLKKIFIVKKWGVGRQKKGGI